MVVLIKTVYGDYDDGINLKGNVGVGASLGRVNDFPHRVHKMRFFCRLVFVLLLHIN